MYDDPKGNYIMLPNSIYDDLSISIIYCINSHHTCYRLN